MIRNRRRSKAPFIIGGVIVAASAVLIYLNFNPIKPMQKEEYFPQGSLCETADMQFTYASAGSLDMMYAFQTTAFKTGIPNAAYSQLPSGIGAKLNNTQYVYIGAYEENVGALATVLDEAPTLIGDNYNRNGSHAEIKASDKGYINGREADYQFVLISADFGGVIKEYYAAYYSIDTTDEEYGICICSITEGTNDGAKNLCVSWIDTISASIIGNPDFIKPSNFSVAELENEYNRHEEGTGSGNNAIAGIEDIDEIEVTDIDDISETGEEDGSNTDTDVENNTSAGSGNNATGNTTGNTSSGNGSGSNSNGNGGGSTANTNPPHTHTYDAGVVTKYANCISTGTKIYTCGCGVTYTETLPITAHNYVGGSCSVCGAADPNQPSTPSTPTTPTTPTTPSTPSYNGSTDVDHNSFDSPFAGATMTVSVWTSAAADGCVCTMTCPDGSVVTASGGGTSFTFVVTSLEGTYTIHITHAARIGQWGASITFGG